MLKIGGYLNIIIAIAHVVGLFWAKPFFEVTGIGREMEDMSLIHPSLPYLITILVTLFFILFGIYGLSADGKFRILPFQKLAIFLIAAIYLLRGVLQLFSDALITGEGATLGTIYSCIALAIGLLYLVGGLKKWRVIKSNIKIN